MKQRIIAFHLLNDKSGSPKILRQLLMDWAKQDQFDVHLFSSQNTNGFLSNLEFLNVTSQSISDAIILLI